MPLRSFAVPFLLAASSVAQAPEPQFVAGDVAALTCRVLDARALEAPFQVLTIEVANRGAVAAEPLTFRLELPAKKGEPQPTETFVRVQLPLVNRYGRPAPAGGKQTYQVPTALPGKKAQVTVRVVDASFYDGGVVSRPDLRIGAPVQVQGKSLAGDFPVTQVKLHNPFDRDVDVLLAVTLQQPRDAVEVYGLRLPANGAVDWMIAQRLGNRPFQDMSGGPGCAVKATKFDVIDWSLVAPSSDTAGTDLLRGPYEAWYRWPESGLTLGGSFVYRERRQKAGSQTDYEDFEVRGRFTVAGDHQLTIDQEGDKANPRMAVTAALETVRRPDFTELAKTNRLVALSSDRVATEGAGWTWQKDTRTASIGGGDTHEYADLQVAGGRIVSDGVGNGPRTVWETMPMGGGWVVTRRHGTSIDERFAYGDADGRIVPAVYTSTTKFGDKLYSSCELLLSDLCFDGVQPIAPVAPAGDGAAALRAIWDAGMRYPTEPLALQAKFEVTNAGTDFVWAGHKRLRGTLSMKGVGRRARDVDVALEGDLAPETKFALAAIVRDRLLMWYGRDFGDRPAFDEFFAGATIGAPGASGEFPVPNGRVTAVSTSGGLVRGWRVPGMVTKLTWKQVGDVQAVVRVDEANGGPGARSQDRWDSATVITLAKVGDNLLPASITFERIFGRDWGPESIVLRDWKSK